MLQLMGSSGFPVVWETENELISLGEHYKLIIRNTKGEENLFILKILRVSARSQPDLNFW